MKINKFLLSILASFKIFFQRKKRRIRFWILLQEARCMLLLLKILILFSQGGEKSDVKRKYIELKAYQKTLGQGGE